MKKLICPVCFKRAASNAQQCCKYCAASLRAQHNALCPECGTSVLDAEHAIHFCPDCGSKIIYCDAVPQKTLPSPVANKIDACVRTLVSIKGNTQVENNIIQSICINLAALSEQVRAMESGMSPVTNTTEA